MEHPLRPVVSAWINKIRLAMDYKKKRFQDDADEAMFFFNGPYDHMYGNRRGEFGRAFAPVSDGDEELRRPTFCMTVNKVAEMVQLFGPALYHRNPVRQVNPRRFPALPMDLFGPPTDPVAMLQQQQMMMMVNQQVSLDQTRSSLLESYLNYTPEALDLKTESRWAIDEALIKGMGTLWTEIYRPAGNPQMQMVGSFYATVDDLAIDPDMRSLRDAKWVARRCIHPYWEVEEAYGLEPGTLRSRASLESFGQQAEVSAAGSDGDYDRKRGLTNDLVVYWKVYSRMGLGARLAGGPGSPDPSPLKQQLDTYGMNVFLVLCENCPYPLNLPPRVIESASDQEILMRVQWPTPFWADDAWPFTPILFHAIPNEVWPMSHLKPGLGEIKFINWAYSFLANKVRVACRDFIGIAKSTGEELKQQITQGTDYTLIEVEALHGSIDAVVKFLQHPPFQRDIYTVIQAVEENFEKRVGLTELMYGMSANQMRSATEAQVKNQQVTVRPDDMANKVEETMTAVARKEALACRWHLQQTDVAPILGPVGAQLWGQLVMASNPMEIIHQLEYRIEAGSTRRPNRERDAANMNQAMQTLFQPLYQYAVATGNVNQLNALIMAWAKSLDMDAEPFLLQAPPPPPPLPEPGPQRPKSSPPGPGKGS